MPSVRYSEGTRVLRPMGLVSSDPLSPGGDLLKKIGDFKSYPVIFVGLGQYKVLRHKPSRIRWNVSHAQVILLRRSWRRCVVSKRFFVVGLKWVPMFFLFLEDERTVKRVFVN